jgi:hypothetical protein
MAAVLESNARLCDWSSAAVEVVGRVMASFCLFAKHHNRMYRPRVSTLAAIDRKTVTEHLCLRTRVLVVYQNATSLPARWRGMALS